MRFGASFAGASVSSYLLLLALPAISSFSYFSPQPHHNVANDHSNDAYSGSDEHPSFNSPYPSFQSDHEALASKRRNFFSKVATASSAATVFSAAGASFASPANAVTTEPTRIELTVETDYLIRVLNYFDGDMRKVLGAIVRSPLTSVVIEPPRSGYGFGGELSPKDAILRALYSYSNPEEYAAQSSWLKVDAPNPWIEFLTKKRYELEIPFFYAKEGEKKGSVQKIVIKPATTLSLSNIEAAVGLAALSYPVAYAYYNYESWQEEQEKLAKKRIMAAKKAKGQKGASKGTVKKGEAPVAVESSETKLAPKTAAMKGQTTVDAKKAKKPFPKRPLSRKEQEAVTMVPNAMTEALNDFFGTKPGPTVAVVDVEPEAVVKPPKYQKQQGELIDHLEFVECKSVSDSEPKAEQALSIEPQKQDTNSIQPQPFSYASPTVSKKSSGGMDAYAAQMAQMMGNAPAAPMQQLQQQQQQQQQSVPHNTEQPPPQTSQDPSAIQPKQGTNSLRSLVQNVKKGSGGMDAYEAQMRAMMERNQGQ